jgi:hypothetical protein
MVTGCKRVLGAIALSILFALSGCAYLPCPEKDKLEEQLAQKDQEIDQLTSSNEKKDMALASYKVRLDERSADLSIAEQRAENAEERATDAQQRAYDAEMQAREAIAAKEALEMSRPSTEPGSSLLPPQAKPGECYARVSVPPAYRTVTEEVLKRGSSERVEIIPAKYEWVRERVLVKEASERVEVAPAKYRWVEEKVMVKESSSRIVEVPGKYEWVEEKVLVKPAHTMWKKGRGPIEKVDNATGEIMCLVEIPATYKTVKKRVMVSPPSTRVVEVPAKYETVKKQIMVKPPTTKRTEIPAVYKWVKVRKMVSPPQERKIEVPAQYQTVTRKEMITEGHMEWRRILCETNVNNRLVARIQRALRRAGHDPVYIDGMLGRRTKAAIRAYQREKGLAVGGLTYETIESLGLNL